MLSGAKNLGLAHHWIKERPMLVLGIETSCDETSAAVVRDGRSVLSCVVASQIEEHRLYGGVVPEIASRRHAECISQVTRQALGEAGVAFSDLDLLAVTHAPGLIGALLCGVNYAKGLSLSLSLPLIGVHHLRSHIAAAAITHPELQPPFVALVVSGGHSHLAQVEGFADYRVIGRTRDDAAGEALDKIARVMGYSYPGGRALDDAAKSGDPARYALPRPLRSDDSLDFSFSGLKTAAINLLHTAGQRGEPVDKNDLAASVTAAVVEMLCERTMTALARTGGKKLVVAGGVSANSHLRRALGERCDAAGVALYLPDLSLCGDNAAMVAAQGYYEHRAGRRSDLTLDGVASLPIDT